MSDRKLSGYWMVVGTVTLVVTVAVWSKGPAIHPSPVFGVTVVLLIDAILLLLRSTVIAAWRFGGRAGSGQIWSTRKAAGGARVY